MNTLGRVVVGFPTTMLLATLLACGTSTPEDFGGSGGGFGSGGGGGGSQVDTVAPTVQITQPVNNSIAPPGFVTLTGTASDNDALERVEVEIRGRSPEMAAGLDNWTYRTPELAAGTYVFIARAIDSSGNTAETQVTVSLQPGAVDTEPPTISITSPAEDAVIGAGPFIVQGTAVDNVGVARVDARLNLSGTVVQATGTDAWSAQLDATSLTSGEHLIIVSGRDLSGNMASIVTRTIVVDRSLPVAEILSAPANPTTSGDASFIIGGANVATYSYSVDGGAFSGAIPVADPIVVSGLRDGPHQLQVVGISIDSVTQVTPTVYDWVVDTTPPIAEVSAPENPTSSDSVSLTVSGDDVSYYRSRLDGGPYSTLTPITTPISEGALAEGAHTIEVLGSDILGNEQLAPTVVTWLIDQTPPDPSITMVTGGPGTITTSDDIDITVGGPGIDEYYYQVDDGPLLGPFPVDQPINIDDLPEGEHTILIYGVDEAGNIQDPPTVITFTIDLDAVVAVVSQPPARTNATSVTLNVSGVDEYRYRLTPPSGAQGPLLGPTNVITPINIDTVAPSPAEGAYSVEVFGISGGTEQVIATVVGFIVDRTPPTAVLANTPPAQTNQPFLNVSVGGAEVATYRYQLDGGPVQGPFDVSAPIADSGIADGPHTLSVFGIDLAGNEQSTATTHNWTVNTGSATAVLSGVPDALTTLNFATITVSGSGVVQYRYRLDGGSLSSPIDVSEPIVLTGLSNGLRTLEVFAINAVGTIQSSPTVATWTVDASVPEAILNNPPPTQTGEESFTFTVSGNGVFEYVYSLDGFAEQGPFPVATPIQVGPLPQGFHYIDLYGINRAGLRQTTPTTYSWSIVQVGPGIAQVDGIDPFTNQTSQSAVVSGLNVESFRWRLDGGAFSAPIPVPVPAAASLNFEVGEGPHTLEVVGINGAGEEQATPTVVSFTVDLTPPEIVSSSIGVILPDDTVVIRFSEPIRTDSGQYSVDGTLRSNAIGGSTLSIGGSSVTLTPGTQWFQTLADSQLVTGFVRDLAGNTTAIEVELVVAADAVYVDGDGGSGDGSSPGSPAGSIGDVAGSAAPGEIIRVTGGTYDETITLVDGVAIVGGWDPTFTTQDPLTNPTVLAPTDLTSAPAGSPTGTVSCNVASGLISGFEIRGAGGSGRAAVVVGPGCGAEVVFTQNRIIADTVTGLGYGVYVEGGAQPAFLDNEIRGGSGNGESYGVYVEQSGSSFTLQGNIIDGWHGNPVSYGVYHDAGDGVIRDNEIYGGTGSKGGSALGRTCPTTADGESVGLLVNASLVIEENGVFGGMSNATGSTCGLSGASTSRGGVINTTQIELDENAFLAGSGPASGCATSLAVGLDTADNDVLETLADGGRACGGAGDTSIALRIRNGATVSVENVIVTGGTAATAIGIDAEPTSGYAIINVTAIDTSGGGSDSIGLRSASAGNMFNTILYGFGTGVLEQSSSGALTAVSNNAFQSTVAYETSFSVAYTNVAELEAGLISASGNVDGGVVFVDLDGADDDLLTFEDNFVSLSSQSSCEVRQGGVANITIESFDIEGFERTASLTCGPTNSDAAGWSIGAYERD